MLTLTKRCYLCSTTLINIYIYIAFFFPIWLNHCRTLWLQYAFVWSPITRIPPHFTQSSLIIMTSSNGNIFRVTGPLCGEFTGPGEFPTQRPVTRSFDVFFHLRLNKQLSKQPRGWWFETPPKSLWRHSNVVDVSALLLTDLIIQWWWPSAELSQTN